MLNLVAKKMSVEWDSYQLVIQFDDGTRQWMVEYDLDCTDTVDTADADVVLTE